MICHKCGKVVLWERMIVDKGENKRLQCVDCGSLFCWYSEQEFESQMQEFQRHLVSKHDRAKTEIERQVLIELKYEGDST